MQILAVATAMSAVCAWPRRRMFDIIKSVMRFQQILLRGLESVRGEWSPVVMPWNFKRMAIPKHPSIVPPPKCV